MRTDTSKELWRVAIHEAAHWIFSEWAGVGNVESVSIVPCAEDKTAGRCRAPLSTYTPQGVRLTIMMCCAGRAAENVLTGTRRSLDGTDFLRAHELAGGNWFHKHLVVQGAKRQVEEYIRGVLWVPILTAASLLYEAKTIEREDARDIWYCVMPEEQPWLLPTMDVDVEVVP